MNEKIYMLFLLKSPFLTGSTRNCRKQIDLEVCVYEATGVFVHSCWHTQQCARRDVGAG